MAGAEARTATSTPRGFDLHTVRPKAPRIDVAFQPANDDVFHPSAHGRAHLAGAGEAHRIEHLQQTGERSRMAVVRRGGEKEAVLELRRYQTQHPTQLAVFAEGRRVLCTSRIVALRHSLVACAPMRLATNQYVRFAIHAAAIAAMNPIMPMNSGPPSVRNEMGTMRSRYAS